MHAALGAIKTHRKGSPRRTDYRLRKDCWLHTGCLPLAHTVMQHTVTRHKAKHHMGYTQHTDSLPHRD